MAHIVCGCLWRRLGLCQPAGRYSPAIVHFCPTPDIPASVISWPNPTQHRTHLWVARAPDKRQPAAGLGPPERTAESIRPATETIFRRLKPPLHIAESLIRRRQSDMADSDGLILTWRQRAPRHSACQQSSAPPNARATLFIVFTRQKRRAFIFARGLIGVSVRI